MQIANLRSGDVSSRIAMAFLNGLAGEKMLRLAMFADAASHAMMLTRLADREQMRSEDFAWRMEELLCKMKMLFVDVECQKSGYVRHIMRVFDNSILIFIRGKTTVIGKTGGMDHLLNACCDRMSCMGQNV